MKKSFVFFFCVIAIPGYGQWRNMNLGAPEGGGDILITAFGVHDTSLFVCWHLGEQTDLRLYRYIYPNNWRLADSGIDFTLGTPSEFASMGSICLMSQGSHHALFTTDNGAHWNKTNVAGPVGLDSPYFLGMLGTSVARSKDGITFTRTQATVPAFNRYAPNGACIFASTSNGVWRSLDTGNTWESIATPTTTINSYAFIGSIVFGTDGAAIKSTDYGTTWTRITISDKNYGVNSLAASGSYLFAGTGGGVFISLDSGLHWRDVSDNLGQNSQFFAWRNITHLQVFDTLLFAAIDAIAPNGDGTARPISEMVNEAKSGVRSVPMVSLSTLMVYPNPLTGRVTVAVGGTTSIEQVSVLNVLGVDLLDLPAGRQSELTLDLSNLPSGTYFLRVLTERGYTLRKVVKE